MPNDGIQIVEAETAAENTDIRMQRKNQMSPKAPTSHANVANHAHEAAARNQNTINLPPDFGQLAEKLFIVPKMPELVWILLIALQIPVGRRSHHQMHRVIRQECKIAGVAVNKSMKGWLHKIRYRR